MSFDATKLGKSGATARTNSNQGPRPERVFLVVDHYETPADGFHYAVGHRADRPDDAVKVRLNTVAERAADRPNENVDKIKAQYVTGENTRDSIAEKAKAGIKLISFDDARRIGQEGGVTEYRAHWPKTMSTKPEAEVMAGFAHIRLKEAGEYQGQRTRAQAYVELIKSSAVVTPDTVDGVLRSALAIKDEQNRARDPFAMLRVLHEGKVVAAPRIYPDSVATKVFDQALGEHKEIKTKVDAGATIDSLMSGKPGRNDFENRQLDTVRALVAGLKGLDEPKFNSPDERLRDDFRNLYFGTKAGALQVEVIGAEKIDFGADSRKTYLADRERPQLAAYVLKEPIQGDDTRMRPAAGFTKTVVTVHRHEDGEPYAVFASPVQMYPKVSKLSDLPLNPAGALAEKVKEAKAPERAPEPEPEPEPELVEADESSSYEP